MEEDSHNMGVIEIDLFPEDVNTELHPEVRRFRRLLEEVGREYHCRLTFFEVENGTISFSFDNDELMTKIIRILQGKEER